MKKLAAFSFLALSITLQTTPCIQTSLNVSSTEIARIERPESRTLYSFPSQGGSTTATGGVSSGVSEKKQLESKEKEISTLQNLIKEQKKWDALKGAVIGSAVGTAATALVFLLASK